MAGYVQLPSHFADYSTVLLEARGKSQQVDLKRIPTLSGEAKDLIQTLLKKNVLVLPSGMPPALLRKISSLEEIQALLGAEAERIPQEKVKKMVQVSLLIVLFVLVSHFAIEGQPGYLTVASLGYLIGAIYLYETALYRFRYLPDIENSPIPFGGVSFEEALVHFAFALLGGGFILPFIETWTRMSRLQKGVEIKKKEIEECLQQYRDTQQQTLASTVSFWEGEGAYIQQMLEGKEQEVIKTLDSMQTTPAAPEQQSFLERFLCLCQRTRAEANKVQNFYSFWSS